MKKYIKLYRLAVRVSFSSAMAYRANFIMESIITLLANIVLPLVTILIYHSGASFPGWGIYEVLMIQSLFTVATGISNMLFSGILWVTMNHVKEGTLEIVLIKPVNCMFYLIATTFSVENLAVVLGGLVLFVVAYTHVAAATAIMWISAMLFFIAGIFVMMGLNLLMAATSFRWVANSRIPELFNSVLNFSGYPQKIFPKYLQAITTFVIPVAMIGCFPASALLGQVTVSMYLALIPCIVFFMIGVFLYSRMVSLYQGVGG